MALVALSNRDNVRYISLRDPSRSTDDKGAETIDETTATVFVLRSLPVAAMATVYDSSMNMRAATEDGKTKNVDLNMTINQSNLETVRLGLVGWQNFVDDNGADVEFKREGNAGAVNWRVAPESLNHLDVDLVQELANEIKAMSRVTKQLQKN
jgi:hypothetical protein